MEYLQIRFFTNGSITSESLNLSSPNTGKAKLVYISETEKGWGGIDKKERDLQGEPGSVITADHRVFCHLSKTQGIRNITHPESALGLNLYYQ